MTQRCACCVLKLLSFFTAEDPVFPSGLSETMPINQHQKPLSFLKRIDRYFPNNTIDISIYELIAIHLLAFFSARNAPLRSSPWRGYAFRWAGNRSLGKTWANQHKMWKSMQKPWKITIFDREVIHTWQKKGHFHPFSRSMSVYPRAKRPKRCGKAIWKRVLEHDQSIHGGFYTSNCQFAWG